MKYILKIMNIIKLIRLYQLDLVALINLLLIYIFTHIYLHLKIINYIILILIGNFQSNVDIVGISPITNRLKNDFTLCAKIYDSLATAKIYLMENSTYDWYDILLFNVTDVINDTKLELILMLK